MNFNLSVQKWHLVSEKGLPKDGTWCFLVWKSAKDGTWCFLVWKSAKDEYEWTIGGYNEAEKYFYANLGLGGMSVDVDEVVAWAELFKDETFTAE